MYPRTTTVTRSADWWNSRLVGGSLKENLPQNEFLRTTRSYTSFVLRLKFKLIGQAGFINAGVQVRSQLIGLQTHGGGQAEAWYKEVTVEELP